MAMPWSLAKAKAKAIREDTSGEKLAALNRLFDQCFRIQKEASFAAGQHIPLVVENVRGAQPWVGRARWNFGSFFLWGDVPALMPITFGRQVMKAGIAHRSNGETNFHGHKVAGFRFDGSGKSFQSASVEATGIKGGGTPWFPDDPTGTKVPSAIGRRSDIGKGARFTSRDCGVERGVKQGGDLFDSSHPSISRLYSSKSPQRKMAAAMIAKIPLPLSRHIGATFRP